MNPIPVRTVETSVQLARSRLTVAVAQLEGPRPNGKRLAVIGGRETYAWSTSEEISRRIDKACTILEQLNSRHEDLDIVLFPEYSLPVGEDYVLGELQRRATEYQQIVIGGADNSLDPATGQVLTRSPVFLPDQDTPVWVTKRGLSQWEYGYIDEPAELVLPVFTWQTREKRFWFSVLICLDLTRAIGLETDFDSDPGLLFVPMCTPDVQTLRTYADVLLRYEAGRAVVLANTVGNGTRGGSSVMAVTPTGEPLKPAVEIVSPGEAVAVFEIDCSRLVLPRKSPTKTQSPIGKRSFYGIRRLARGYQVEPMSRTDEESAITRGVINPAVFFYCGKRMRVAFLQVENYRTLVDSAKGKEFEILAILGHHDVMVSHVASEAHEMVIDITDTVQFKSLTRERIITEDGKVIDERQSESMPRFRVDTYYKVLGLPVDLNARRVFHDHDHSVPTGEDLAEIFALGKDWNDRSVDDSAREKFLERRWILGRTTRRPGDVSTVMAISLNYHGEDLDGPFEVFEDRIMPRLVEMPEVTSLYRGTPTTSSIHYLLRTTARVGSLFELINQIHEMAHDARLLLSTTTYVVVERLSSLDLGRACLIPTLPRDDDFYRATRIIPFLTATERTRLISMPAEEQLQLIGWFRNLDAALSASQCEHALQLSQREVLQRWARGILSGSMELLKEPHDMFFAEVERALKTAISEHASEDDLDSWREELNVHKGKTTEALTYGERIRFVDRLRTTNRVPKTAFQKLDVLPATIQVRNAFAHSDYDKVTLETYVRTMAAYSEFLGSYFSTRASVQEIDDIGEG